MPRIFYNSLGTPDVYQLLRDEMPPGFELVTLETDSDRERCRRIADCEVVITAAYPLGKASIDAAVALKLVLHQGVGYHDTVDCAALRARGIGLALTPEGTAVGVAEHAVMLMLAVTRRLAFADAELRQGRFHINALRPASREIHGRLIGYVGMGRIGQGVAERLKPFGASGLYAYGAAPLAAEREAELGIRHAGLDEVLTRADILTLHLPLTAATRHIIDATALDRMKPGAVLINTARGGLIDETALHAALTTGSLGGAGLDVFETEPVPAGHPLAALPNVVLTPHIAAGTRDALRTKMQAVSANIRRFYAGEALHHEVGLID